MVLRDSKPDTNREAVSDLVSGVSCCSWFGQESGAACRGQPISELWRQQQ